MTRVCTATRPSLLPRASQPNRGKKWLLGACGVGIRVVASVALVFLAVPAFGASRGPSTPEERQRAVAVVRALEEDPLNRDARQWRQWLVAWLSEIPDITVSMCLSLLGETFESERRYGAELGLQQSLSSAAFMIEHPDRVQDRLAVSLAGVEGVIAAYEALLSKKPKARFASLDALLEAREKGELQGVVASNMESCD
jgi:carboxypeptidase Q